MCSIELGRPVRGERTDAEIVPGLGVGDGRGVCVGVSVGVGRSVSCERIGICDVFAAGRGTIAGWGEVATRIGSAVRTRGLGVCVGGPGVEPDSIGAVVREAATGTSLSVQLASNVARLPADNILVSRRLLRRAGIFMRNSRSVLAAGRDACNRMRRVESFVQCKRFYGTDSADVRVGLLRGPEYTMAGSSYGGRALMCRQPTQIVAKDFNPARALVPCSVQSGCNSC